MNEWCIKQHGASGLTQACRESKVGIYGLVQRSLYYPWIKVSCAEAERMVLDMVARHTNKGECPLAGECET